MFIFVEFKTETSRFKNLITTSYKRNIINSSFNVTTLIFFDTTYK